MVECNSPLFKPGIHTVISFQIKQYRKEEKIVNSQWRTLHNFHSESSQLIVYNLDMIYNKNSIYMSVVFLPKLLSHSLIVRKPPDKSHWEHSTKYLTSTSENCHGHKKTRNVWETVTDREASGDITINVMGILDRILQRKRKLRKS